MPLNVPGFSEEENLFGKRATKRPPVDAGGRELECQLRARLMPNRGGAIHSALRLAGRCFRCRPAKGFAVMVRRDGNKGVVQKLQVIDLGIVVGDDRGVVSPRKVIEVEQKG